MEKSAGLLAALDKEAFEGLESPLTEKQFLRCANGTVNENRNWVWNHSFVAYEGKEIAAYALFAVQDHEDDKKKTLIAYRSAVAKEFRGKLSSPLIAMLKTANDEAMKVGYERVEAWVLRNNINALFAWQNIGFIVVGETEHQGHQFFMLETTLQELDERYNCLLKRKAKRLVKQQGIGRERKSRDLTTDFKENVKKIYYLLRKNGVSIEILR